MAVPLICRGCACEVSLVTGSQFSGETRFMWVDSDNTLRISQRLSVPRTLKLDFEVRFRLSTHHQSTENEALVCGQGCALILAERYMERSTFDPAPRPVLNLPSEYAKLTGATK